MLSSLGRVGLLILVMLAAGGQGVVIAPPPTTTAAPKLEFSIGEGVGRGDFLCVPVTMAGKEHLFVVDTGATGTVVGAALAKALGDAMGPQVGETNAVASLGESVKMPLYRAPRMEIRGQRIWPGQSQVVAVADEAWWAQGSGRPVEGILGLDVLSQFVLRLDFRRHVLELMDPASFEAPRPQAAESFRLSFVDGAPMAFMPFVASPDAVVEIDTGDTGTGAVMPEIVRTAVHAGLHTEWRRQPTAAGVTTVRRVRLDSRWTLAGTAYPELWLDESFRNVIGLSVLANYVVTMDFRRDRLYLESIRTEHPREPPPLDLAMYMDHGQVRVGPTMEQAAALGMPGEDELVAVDGKSVAGMELWALEEQLRRAAAPVMTLRREGKDRQVTLHQRAAPATGRGSGAATRTFPFGPGVGRGDILGIPVKVAGKEHLFMLATGLAVTVIDSELVSTLGDALGAPQGDMSGKTVTGESWKMARYRGPPLEIGGRAVPLQEPPTVAVMDLSAVREASGRPVRGLLGMDALASSVLRVDFRRHVVELIDAEGFAAPSSQEALSFQLLAVKGTPAGALPFMGLADRPVGIWTSYQSVGSIGRASLERVAEADVGVRHWMGWSPSGPVGHEDVRLRRSWTLAGTAFREVWLEKGQWDGLGLAALANYVVTLDFPRMRLYLESIRPAHPIEPPAMEFGVTVKEGRFRVRFPEEKAVAWGIMTDDEITAVDGKSVAGMEIWALREQLRQAKAPRVTFRRGEQSFDITLKRNE